jgi:small subunit ribosomal protein S19
MMVKEFNYRGLSEETLMKMSLDEFAKIVTARMRRTLNRGLTPFQKRLLTRVKVAKKKGIMKPLKTHCRDMPIVPAMLGLTITVYNGKVYIPVQIDAEKLGHYLGEFARTRTRVQHSAPGVGATRSSKFIPLK